MMLMYGPAFTAAYGDAPNIVWESAISKLTDEQCRKGLSALAKQGREYPANLTQFVAACTEKPGVRYLGGPSAAYNPKALEGPRATLANVEARLANMRRAVSAARVPRIARQETAACTCQGLGECPVCQSWAKRMLELNGEQAQPA